MSRNWIKDLVDEKRAEEARRQAIAFIALGSADPTDTELKGFTPGQPIEPSAGATGASPMTDPSGATLDLQRELRNEELARAAEQSAPAVMQFRRSQAFKDAGLNESDVALAAARRAQLPGFEAHSASEQRRGQVLDQTLSDPNLDPLLGIDIAQNKAVFKPKNLVKVRDPNGRDVYYHRTLGLDGNEAFEPALDGAGRPLQAPPSAAAARGFAPGYVPKNVQWIADNVSPFREEPDRAVAIDKAFERFSQTKSKSPREAYANIVRDIAKENFGALSPETLKEKANARWRIMRPGEPLPTMSPDAPAAATTGTAVPARPGAAASPADVFPPAAAAKLKEGVQTRFGNGQVWTLRNGRPERVQ